MKETKLIDTVDISRDCNHCNQSKVCTYFKQGSLQCGWAEYRLTELTNNDIMGERLLETFLKSSIFMAERAEREHHPDAFKLRQQACNLLETFIRIKEQYYEGVKEKRVTFEDFAARLPVFTAVEKTIAIPAALLTSTYNGVNSSSYNPRNCLTTVPTINNISDFNYEHKKEYSTIASAAWTIR